MGNNKMLFVQSQTTPVVVNQRLNSINDIEEYLGGKISLCYPYGNDVAVAYCPQAAEMGMSFNRGITNEKTGADYLVYGNFIVVGCNEEQFIGLTDEQILKYEKQLHTPEVLVNYGDESYIMKMKNYVEATNGILSDPDVEARQNTSKVVGSYEIYQLNNKNPEAAAHLFMSYDWIQEHGGIKSSDYNFIYQGDYMSDWTLESLYTKFQRGVGDTPIDFSGHSLSLSDIVVVEREGKTQAWMVDTFGFKAVPEFLKSKAIDPFANLSISEAELADKEVTMDVSSENPGDDHM